MDPQEKEFQKMIEDIQNHEKNYSGHFNIMIIKLKKTVCRKLFEEQEFDNLISKLSCCYNFYLHPKYKFEILEKLISDKKKNTSKSSNKRYLFYFYEKVTDYYILTMYCILENLE